LLGYWREPDRPDKTLQGTLKFIPNKGGYLTLIGAFKDLKLEDLGLGRELKEIMKDIQNDPKYEDKKHIDTIHGFTVDGKEVTLRNCEELNFQLSVANNQLLFKTEFWVQIVIVGAWFTQEIKLRGMSVVFSHIDEWLTIFKIGMHVSFSAKELYIAAISEDEQLFPADNGLDITFEIPTKIDELRNLKGSLKKITIEQYPLFNLKFLEDKTLDDYHQIMIRLRNLLSMLLCHPINILSIKCTSEVAKVIKNNVNYYSEIEIFFHLLLSRILIPIRGTLMTFLWSMRR
ncbi:MAG TPA: hypothetical protein VF220_05115, partial [Nitrososphaeraceae archaeon]